MLDLSLVVFNKEKVTKRIGKVSRSTRNNGMKLEKCSGGLYFKIADLLILLSIKKGFSLRQIIQSSCRSPASRPAEASPLPHRSPETLSVRWAGQNRAFIQWLSSFAAVEQPTLCFPTEFFGRWASTLFNALWRYGNEWEESRVSDLWSVADSEQKLNTL